MFKVFSHTANSSTYWNIFFRRKSGQCEHAHKHALIHTSSVGYDQERRTHQAWPCLVRGNHALSLSSNTAYAQRTRKQNCCCHLFVSLPVQTSEPPQHPVIKSLGLTNLCEEIRHLSLFHPCLYLDKQMTTCSEPVQHLNKGAWRVGLIFHTEHWTCWPCSYLPVYLDIQTQENHPNALTLPQRRESVLACEAQTHKQTNIPRASSCLLVRLMPLLCVPTGSCKRLGTCLDTSLRQDFIGRKGRLGSLQSTVNGSAYQILLSSTSLATI